MNKASLFLLCAALLSTPAQSFETKAREAIIIDHETQAVLLAKAESTSMPPSSMSKLMTLYLLFEQLKSGALTLDSTFPVSEKAWKKGGSKMFVRVGTDVRVEDLIRGIIVQSGNDACIVVAEALGGSEAGFAKLMNQKAKQLQLSGSNFVNATGWPDEGHVMTPADLAKLSRHFIEDFPEYYPYFAETEFTYSNIRQTNRNRLLGRDMGVDGLKTGHTEIAGYGITVSARDEQTGRRVHVVVNGLKSDAERINEAGRLARHGLRDFMRVALPARKPLQKLAVHVGARESVAIGLAQETPITLPRDVKGVRFELHAQAPLAAPIFEGQPLGQLHVTHAASGRVIQRISLVALEDVGKASLWQRFVFNLKWLIK